MPQRDNTSGEIALSVEETNKLRQSLGLKPLKEQPSDSQPLNQAKEEAEKKEKTYVIRDKVKKAKEKRREEAFFSQVKKLGDAESGSEDDLEAWIEKTRTAEKAEQLMKTEPVKEPEDESDADPGMVPELVGKKVKHKSEDIQVGETMILTLADQPILTDKGELNTTEDALENALKAEEARRKRAYRASKPKQDEMYDEFGDKKSLLNKYDEEEEEAMTLDPVGGFELNSMKPGMHVKEESLQTSLNSISDYMPTETTDPNQEKRRKRQKIRKKKESGVLDIVAELEAGQEADSMEWEADHGSRRDLQSRIEQEEKEGLLKKEQKAKKFDKALEKANLHALKLKLLEDGDHDEDNDDLYASLKQAQFMASEQTNTRFAQMAEDAKKKEEVQSSAAVDKKLVFTDTTEFCRLFAADGVEVKKQQFSEEEDEMEQTDILLETKSERRRHLRVTKPNEDTMKQPTKEENPDDDTGALREPILGSGLATALNTLRDKGDLKEKFEWVGRTNDMKKSRLIGVDDFYKCGETVDRLEKSIETALTRKDHLGRVLTPKEAFREISYAFHGKGPSQKTLEKRKRKLNEDFLARKSNLDQESQLNRLKAVQKVQKNAFVVLSGNEVTGKQTKGKKKKLHKKNKTEGTDGGPTDPFPSLTPILDKGGNSETPLEGKKKVEAMFGIQPSEDN